MAMYITRTLQREENNGYPVVLNGSTFVDVVKNQDWLVLFHASWCRDCKVFMPIFMNVSSEVYPLMKTAMIDCVGNEDICKFTDVQHFPQLKLYRNNSYSNYNSSYDSEGVLRYIQQISSIKASSFIQSIINRNGTYSLRDTRYGGTVTAPATNNRNDIRIFILSHCLLSLFLSISLLYKYLSSRNLPARPHTTLPVEITDSSMEKTSV